MLSLDPTSRGFGYAVLEAPDLLIDWGVCQVRIEKREGALRKVAALIHRFAPDTVVVEDTRDQHCRRGQRARDLILAIVALARTMDVAVVRVSRTTVRDHYTDLGATNKDAVARLVVEGFPELESFLPPRRRTWMPEHERMAVFDAISMVLVLAESAEASSTPRMFG
ncbi:MAG: hypothetical protein HYR72_27105 [Deltaproteobacteria bacterium]|nr:hypothetical protein [Deltaproteobacteria bacterium]MBI3390316.1 hypothetical protein [Deltaproteobacteria bacterium]